jgi:hypothetical protein
VNFVRIWSRRSVLTSGGALLLAACGSSGASNGKGAPASGDPDGGDLDGAVVLARWNNAVLVPGLVRLPVSFGRDNNILTDGPDRVTGRILDLDDNLVVDGLVATKRNTGIPNAYWPFTVELTTPALYRLVVDGAAPEGQALQVNDPSLVSIPQVGQPLPPFDTPTVTDARGVDPVCTAVPACPFHAVTLTEALAAGKPVAYLIGTPAYCSTGFCGPILDLLGNVAEKYGDRVTVVHAEVYTDSTITTAAPAVEAYELTFEPLLFVTDAAGILVHRLDAAFDEAEMDAAVASVLA